MKKNQDLLNQAAQIASQCDRCGNCLTVCPLYEERDIESSCARGKNNLALGLAHGVIKTSPQMLEATNFCPVD